jgi:hypothetical protein
VEWVIDREHDPFVGRDLECVAEQMGPTGMECDGIYCYHWTIDDSCCHR